MNPRKLTATRSIFYRGISLKEYLVKSSATQPNLEYRDQQTILVDQNKIPVIIDDDFIQAEPITHHELSPPLKNQSAILQNASASRSRFYLPAMSSGKQIKTKVKSSPTERNSTDTSLGSSFEMRIPFLPSIEKKQVIRQRNITMTSRQSSRETSCRKKITQMWRVVEQEQVESFLDCGKKMTKMQQADEKKEKIMKQRYNVREGIKFNSNKSKYFERVKSYAQ